MTPAPSSYREAWSKFIDDSAKWTHAYTVTLKRHIGAQGVSKEHMYQAARHFLRRLDYRCLGRNRVKRGAFVSSVVVYGWGTYDNHPHLHLALVCPAGLSESEFIDCIEQAASKVKWFDRERKLEKYVNSGWATYMVDHDPENLYVSLMRIPKNQL
jgi:hypothetical protein